MYNQGSLLAEISMYGYDIYGTYIVELVNFVSCIVRNVIIIHPLVSTVNMSI